MAASGHAGQGMDVNTEPAMWNLLPRIPPVCLNDHALSTATSPFAIHLPAFIPPSLSHDGPYPCQLTVSISKFRLCFADGETSQVHVHE